MHREKKLTVLEELDVSEISDDGDGNGRDNLEVGHGVGIRWFGGKGVLFRVEILQKYSNYISIECCALGQLLSFLRP